jgi:hypothetical protein
LSCHVVAVAGVGDVMLAHVYLVCCPCAVPVVSVCQLRSVVLALGLTIVALVADQVVLHQRLADTLAALAEQLGNLFLAGVSESVVPQFVYRERAQLVRDGPCKVCGNVLIEQQFVQAVIKYR